MEDKKMLFLCYWELNENMPVIDHLKLGKMLLESGLFPPPGIELIRFDMTPDYWGINETKRNRQICIQIKELEDTASIY